MKRPSPQASTDSWVSIWLGCMGARFSATGSGTKSTSDHDDANGKRKKIPKSVHQPSCGHGYRPYDSYHVHPAVAMYGLGSDLGSTPAEYAGMRRALNRRL